MRSEEIHVLCQSRKHLSSALTMTNIRDLDDSSLRHDELEQSWLIISPHFHKGIVPEFLVTLWFQVNVVLAVPIPSGVIHPNIIAILCQNEC